MAVPAWFFAPSSTSNATARGVALVPFNGGMAVPDWTTPRYFPFVSESALANGNFETPVLLGTGSPGLSCATADGSNGMWLVSYTGSEWHVAAGSRPSLVQTLPPNQAYIGVSPSGHVLAAGGTIFTASGNALAAFPTPAIGSLTSSGTTMQAILPASGIGLMSSTGVTGLIAPPGAMPVISCIMASGGVPLAAGGWAPAATLAGAAGAGLDPQDNEIMLAVGNGRAFIWGNAAPLTENWAPTAQLVTGTANLNSMCWVPNGIQVLATSLTSGAVQVLDFSVSVLSLAQTLTISGAVSVAVAGNSTNALVAQSGMSQLATLTSSEEVWSVGSPITGLPGITTVVPFGATGAIAAFSAGIAYLGLDDTWSIQQVVALGFQPTALAVDPFLQVYAAGSGQFSVTSGTARTGSGFFNGEAPTSIAVQQGRLIMAVPGSGLAIFGNTTPGAWTQQGSQSSNATTLALSETVLFAMNSGDTTTFGFSGTPYELTSVTSGVFGLWNGTAWTTQGLGIGHNPSAVGFDASGNVWLTTVQNTLWHFNPSGGLLSPSPTGIVTQIPSINGSPGQPQSVPLGPSAILVASGDVFVATSLSGVLIQVG